MSDIQEHVVHLTQEVDPHPAGTEEEQQAAFYIADRLEEGANLPAAIEEFSCSLNFDLPRIIYCAVAVVMGLLTLFVPALVIPSFILTAIAAVLYIVDVLRIFSFGQFFHSGISQNVVAKYQPTSSRQSRRGRSRKIVFVARYDSGKIQQELRKPFISILPALHWAEFVAIILIPILLLIRFIAGAGGGLLIFINIIVVICAILVLLPIITYLIHFAADYEEGANCNAAGVAVMLETAARVGQGHLSENTPMASDVDSPVIHGEAAAREGGLVPEGADLVYEAPITQAEDGGSADDSAESRLMAAKAAVAAISGKEVSGVANIDSSYYPDQRQIEDVGDYETQSQTNVPMHTFDEESYADKESFAPVETAESIAYSPEDSADALSATTQIHSTPDDMKENLQEPSFPTRAYTDVAPLTTDESYDLRDSDIPASDLETASAMPPEDTTNDAFNGFVTDTDNTENKGGSIPSWFKSAQEKAHKPANGVIPVQRSHYADALDSAMNESKTYFKQANDAITSETEQRLQHMRDSIMEVTPPSFDDINNALADADRQCEENKVEEINAVNETSDLSSADIEIADKDGLDNISSNVNLFSDDSLVDTTDSALEVSEEPEITEEVAAVPEAILMHEDHKKGEEVLAYEDTKATFIPEEHEEYIRHEKYSEFEEDLAPEVIEASEAPEKSVVPEKPVATFIPETSDELEEALVTEDSGDSKVSEESVATFMPETPKEYEATLEIEEPEEVLEPEKFEEFEKSEEPKAALMPEKSEVTLATEEFEKIKAPEIPEEPSLSSVVSNAEDQIKQQDRIQVENELYGTTEDSREEADLGRTISFIPVAIDEEQLRQEISERNIDNMSDVVDVSQDLSQEAESIDNLSSQNKHSAASTEDEDNTVIQEQSTASTQEQSTASDRFVVPKVFSQSSTATSDAGQKTTSRRRRNIDLPGLTQSLSPVSDSPDEEPDEELKQSAPLGDDALLSHDRSEKLKELSFPNDVAESATSAKDELAARQAALRTSLPSVSGSITFEDAQAYVSDFTDKNANKTINEAESSANVSQAGSFASAGATGAFDPVGNELVEDIAPDEIYVDDADDSDYNDQFTEMGAFAGPGYVEMPKSRASRLFGRFRRSNKKSQEEKAPQQWLNVEDDFEAREVGKERGNWESFKENDQKDVAFDVPEDFSEDDNLAKADAAVQEVDYVEKDPIGRMSAFDDDDPYDTQSSLWDGGAFGRRRMNEISQNESQLDEKDVVEEEPQLNVQDTAQVESQADAQEKAAQKVARRDAARGTRGNQGAQKERGSRRGRDIRGDSNARSDRSAQNIVQEVGQSQREVQEQIQEEGNQEKTSSAADLSRTVDMQRIRQFRYGAFNTEVWFVALGCEIADNGGMKAFMNEHADELKGSIIVELEGLGAGELTLVEHEGTYRAVKSSSRAKRYIRKAASALGLTVDSKPMRWKESSAACAARSGYQTMHLAGMKDDKPAYYGEADDVIEQVSERTMRQNTDFIIEFLKNI